MSEDYPRRIHLAKQHEIKRELEELDAVGPKIFLDPQPRNVNQTNSKGALLAAKGKAKTGPSKERV